MQYSTHLQTALFLAAIALNTVGVLSLHAALTVQERRDMRIQERGLHPFEVERASMTPVRLRIASINVDAPIVPVGLRDDGLMDIPETSHEIGWFSLGYAPGQSGNAVLAGHLDQENGLPAVFWELRRLKLGDEVQVVRTDGSVARFRVIRRSTYVADKAPLEALFGTSSGAHLNLVTCNGAWQEDLRTYDKRLVVYTEQIL